MKILLLTKYGRLGVTSRIRFLQYIPYLEEHGIHVRIAPFLEDDYIDSLFKGRRNWPAVAAGFMRRFRQIIEARRYDLLWIEKELLTWMPAVFEPAVRPYVVDYDDATFHSYDLHPNGAVRLFLGDKIRKVMTAAQAVVAGNEYLANYARASGASNVHYVPTVVDLKRYSAVETPANDVFTIGWIGSPWTARYLPAIAPALREICRNGQARVTLIGSGNLDMSGIPIEYRDWNESTEVEELRRIDVGIMPLSDLPFERGKCGYKLIQYMACGKPVVATPVGANSSIV